MKANLSLLLLLTFNSILFSQNFKDRFDTIDIKHYNLNIEVNDTTKNIVATMNIYLKFKKINLGSNFEFNPK